MNASTTTWHRTRRAALAAGVAWLCLGSAPVVAGEETTHVVGSHELFHGDEDAQPFAPFPLLRDDGGLRFDTGENDRREFNLRLAEPLTLGAATRMTRLDDGSLDAGAGLSLDWLVPGGVRLGASVEQRQVPFQPLGAIHCANGTLAAGSFTATDCFFVDTPTALGTSERVSLGARVEGPGHSSATVNLFQQRADAGSGVQGLGSFAGAPMMDAGLLTPVLTNPLLPPAAVGQPLDYLESEVSGVDVEFQLGFATDNAGDVLLGLQLTRVLDGDFGAVTFGGASAPGWTLAEPVDSARLSLDWNRGAFSGGIQSFYREPVEFLNRSQLDGVTTFDVHFTWRTPWNASLSVGASNVLGAGADEPSPADNTSADPFESIYGRIPYVRYKQDL